MPFWKEPRWGWLLHLAVSVGPLLINLAVAYITDPSNPLGLNPTVLGLVVTLGNVILSQIRNAGQVTATVLQPAATLEANAPDLAAGTTVIIQKS